MTTESTQHTSGGMHTRLVNTAADVISRAMQQGRTLPAALAVALDSAQLLQSPDTAAELEKLRRCHDEDGKALKAAMRRDRESCARITELEAAQGTVYRASHDTIPMGLYLTREAAQQHCETSARASISGDVSLDWDEDELTVTRIDGSEYLSGYVVDVLEVAAEYDEEADQ
ncbi:hypothetical protein OHA99_09245 [Streptomyces coelicoflavus]|uniref:hypothetical protein n=1 Tax=Streptomyces coelicoflavus TaxID=285562 RepID=UPI00324D16EA